jgi:hypothetical protein
VSPPKTIFGSLKLDSLLSKVSFSYMKHTRLLACLRNNFCRPEPSFEIEFGVAADGMAGCQSEGYACHTIQFVQGTCLKAKLVSSFPLNSMVGYNMLPPSCSALLQCLKDLQLDALSSALFHRSAPLSPLSLAFW